MRSLFAIIVIALSAVVFNAQTASNDPWPFPDRKRQNDEDSQMVKEMLAKQQSSREKKEYASLVERGEEALQLSRDLEKSFEKNEALTDVERKQLEEFEKLVAKIRDDLGGDDDGETTVIVGEEKDSPKDVREGFLYLKNSTQQLVCEIKRSTRFSVSVVAIESSNALIRLARFLRLKN
ncbi:MAG TPA: hypothetical protein PLK77_05210 [Pyrinomonadaceae bacterium]|nr:hypothetical protein [Pyrinomonadaceae bacterium]